jgi:hypothetical protein
MVVTIPRTGTELVANQITFTRGAAADVTAVGVFHTTDPTKIPTVAEFTTAQLVLPGDPLAEGTKIDVLSLIGPRGGTTLAAGDYQRWVRVSTATEDILRRVDVVTIQ